MSLFVEHVDEAFADDFALALRVGDAFQLAEELLEASTPITFSPRHS